MLLKPRTHNDQIYDQILKKGVKMLGVWLENNEINLRDDIPTPTAENDEVLIEVLMAGICNTDLELMKGYYPYQGILGHEFVGIVRSNNHALNGERVVGTINVPCLGCPMCKENIYSHCYDRKALGINNKNGCFAEYITLPTHNLMKVPANVSDEAATFTEPLAAALQIQTQIHIKPSDRILVIGDGKLGNLIVQTLLIKGYEVWLQGKHEIKIKKLLDKGALQFKPTMQDLFDVTIECSGHPAGFATAIQHIKPRGTIVMKSTYAQDIQLNISQLVVNEVNLIGSRCGPFKPALNLLEKGLIDCKGLIDSIYPLRKAISAFSRAKESGSGKVLIKNS
jgi:threonine dehydrogenase-like Zn-dependent dehydrogenase